MAWQEVSLDHGHPGAEFSPVEVTCPYCRAHGNFHEVFHGHNREPGWERELNFEVLQCWRCTNYVFVIWRRGEGTHDFRVFPPPARRGGAHASWPAKAAQAYGQAIGSLQGASWDAAGVMLRRALDSGVTELGVSEQHGLFETLAEAARRGLMTRPALEWALHLRPVIDGGPDISLDEAQAEELVQFTSYLLDLFFALPPAMRSALKKS